MTPLLHMHCWHNSLGRHWASGTSISETEALVNSRPVFALRLHCQCPIKISCQHLCRTLHWSDTLYQLHSSLHTVGVGSWRYSMQIHPAWREEWAGKLAGNQLTVHNCPHHTPPSSTDQPYSNQPSTVVRSSVHEAARRKSGCHMLLVVTAPTSDPPASR